MLNVALGRGSLELRSALLNTDYLNAQLVRGCCFHALLHCPWPAGGCLHLPVSGDYLVVAEHKALLYCSPVLLWARAGPAMRLAQGACTSAGAFGQLGMHWLVGVTLRHPWLSLLSTGGWVMPYAIPCAALRAGLCILGGCGRVRGGTVG